MITLLDKKQSRGENTPHAIAALLPHSSYYRPSRETEFCGVERKEKEKHKTPSQQEGVFLCRKEV